LPLVCIEPASGRPTPRIPRPAVVPVQGRTHSRSDQWLGNN